MTEKVSLLLRAWTLINQGDWGSNPFGEILQHYKWDNLFKRFDCGHGVLPRNKLFPILAPVPESSSVSQV